MVAAGGLLAACGGDSEKSSGSTAGPAARKGGTLTVGMLGNGGSETLNPVLTLTSVDFMRTTALFDLLWATGPDVASVVPKLAASADPSPDAKTWTIHLREDVTWHDGTPLTADDLVWTLKAWGNPKSTANGSVAPVIDFNGVRKRGPLSVEVPLKLSVGEFPSLVSVFGFGVIKNGSTPAQLATNPIGTGPYKFKSFKAGHESVFEANPDYWGGRPPIDTLIVNSTFSDDTARVNALLAGNIQVAPRTPYLLAKQHASSSQVKVMKATAPNAYMFSLRVDQAPFDDARVRKAIKLIADRPALIEGALAGFGVPGNDLLGQDAKYFARDLSRSQDIEQARSLLKSAGREGMSVTLQTSSAAAGLLEAGTLFAQQAKAAGVNVKVQALESSVYYTDAGGWMTRTFGENLNGMAYPSLTSAYLSQLWTDAPYNDGHWGARPGQGDKPLFTAIGTLDEAGAQEAWNEVQQKQFEEGPYLIWGNADFVDMVAPNVAGLSPSAAGPLNNYDFSKAGLA
jgi:peptide/nickel transport system substrate-binding protein